MSRSESHSDTVVVLVALPVEAKAVCAHLDDVHPRKHPAGTRFKVGTLPGTAWQVAVAVMGEGGAGAGTITERAATLFQPAAVFSISVAGALRDDIAPGDVVVATRVYSYQAGKAAEEFGSRPRSWEADHDLLQIAIDVEGAGTWGKRLSHNSRRPATHFKPVAAGKVVLDARNVPLYAYLRRNFNDAVAITMDSDEIAQAGHLNRSLPVMAICGISDPANGMKAAADQAGWQPIAAANAAAFAIEVIAELPSTRRPRPPEHFDVPKGGPSNIPSGIGKLVFETRIEHPVGPMIVGFGPGDTLLITERNAMIHRWSLGEGTALRGMPRGDPLPYGFHAVTSTATPTVAIVRAGYVTLVHFDDDGNRTTRVPLEPKEFLVPVDGERFATYTGRRVAVRDFADGSVLWEQPCPPWRANTAIDHRGEAVAIAYGSNYFATNKIIVTTRADMRPRHISFDNNPLLPGCMLGLSPGGDLLVCRSSREIVLIRTSTQGSRTTSATWGSMDDIFPALGHALAALAASHLHTTRRGAVAHRQTYRAHPLVRRRILLPPSRRRLRRHRIRPGWLSSRRRQQGRTDPRLGVARTMRRMPLVRERMP